MLPMLANQKTPTRDNAIDEDKNNFEVNTFSRDSHGLKRVTNFALATAIDMKLAVINCKPSINETREKIDAWTLPFAISRSIVPVRAKDKRP